MGADFQVIRSPTASDLDARYVIEADNGERLYVSNQAYRTGSAEDMEALSRGVPVPPERIYFRCTPRFEVAGENLSWLESTVVAGAGVRTPNAVLINLCSILKQPPRRGQHTRCPLICGGRGTEYPSLPGLPSAS